MRSLNKRGEDTKGPGLIVVIVIAVLVLVVVVWGVFGFGIPGKLKDLIPSFNNTQPAEEGSGIIGLKLQQDGLSGEWGASSGKVKLQRYTGSEWIAFGAEEKSFAFRGSNYDTTYLKESLEAYYFTNLERKGSKNIRLSDGSYLVIDSTSVYPYGFRGGYVTLEYEDPTTKEIRVFYLSYGGTLYEEPRQGEAIQQGKFVHAVPSIVAWRDQFLEGGFCERFITLNGNDYSVRKINLNDKEAYLVVDLSRPVTGNTQKYPICVAPY